MQEESEPVREKGSQGIKTYLVEAAYRWAIFHCVQPTLSVISGRGSVVLRLYRDLYTVPKT